MTCTPAPAELVATRAGDTDVEPADPFRWTEVVAESRQWLKAQTEQIQSLAYRQACDMVRIGQLLCGVRDRLPSRTFGRWVESELPWVRSHAYRLIQVGEQFGPFLSHAETERIEPSALYLLASPSAPPLAREYAVELARVKKITAGEARKILTQHRQINAVPDPTRSEMRSYERDKRNVGIDEKPSAPEIQPPSMKEMAWDALESLVSQYDLIHISRVDDAEPYPDEQTPASVTCLGGSGERRAPRNDVGHRLIDVVLRLAGREQTKVCLGKKCESKGRPIPLSQFSECRKYADGRNAYCLRCERKRVQKYDRKKQAARSKAQSQSALTA